MISKMTNWLGHHSPTFHLPALGENKHGWKDPFLTKSTSRSKSRQLTPPTPAIKRIKGHTASSDLISLSHTRNRMTSSIPASRGRKQLPSRSVLRLPTFWEKDTRTRIARSMEMGPDAAVFFDARAGGPVGWRCHVPSNLVTSVVSPCDGSVTQAALGK